MTEFRDKLALRDRCEEEGRQARAAGLKQYDNPYHTIAQNEERSAWSNGWWEKAPIKTVNHSAYYMALPRNLAAARWHMVLSQGTLDLMTESAPCT